MKLTIELIKEWYADQTFTKPDILLTEDYTDVWAPDNGERRTFGSSSADDIQALQLSYDIGLRTKGYGDTDEIGAEDWKPWCEGQKIDVVDVQEEEDNVKCLLEAEDGSYVWCYISNDGDSDDVQEIIDSITIEE